MKKKINLFIVIAENRQKIIVLQLINFLVIDLDVSNKYFM